MSAFFLVIRCCAGTKANLYEGYFGELCPYNAKCALTKLHEGNKSLVPDSILIPSSFPRHWCAVTNPTSEKRAVQVETMRAEVNSPKKFDARNSSQARYERKVFQLP